MKKTFLIFDKDFRDGENEPLLPDQESEDEDW